MALSPVCSLPSQQPLRWPRLQRDLRGHQWNGKHHHQLHRRQRCRQLNTSLGEETWCSRQSTSLSTTFMMLIASLFNHRRKLREWSNWGISEPGATKSQMAITDASKCWCFYLHYAFFTIWNCIKMIEPRQKKMQSLTFFESPWGQNWHFLDNRVNKDINVLMCSENMRAWICKHACVNNSNY